MRRLKGIGIGTGYFSSFHYEAWNRLADKAEIVAIFALGADEAMAMAARHGIAEGHSIEAIESSLTRIKPDFVDIIAPPSAHKQLVELCVAHGIAIICQKPLGRHFIEAQEIVALTENARVPFMVHENWRWQPWYRKMAELVGDGNLLGKIHSISSTMRMGDGWTDDAYLARQLYFREYPRLLIFETGVHFLDTFRFLGGEIASVYARVQKHNPVIRGEDAAQIMCGFESGATAILDASRFNESEHDNPRYTFGTTRIDCAAGHVRLNEDGQLWAKRLGEPLYRVDYSPAATGFAGDCVFSTLEHFVTTLTTGRNFESDGNSYLKTMALVEACYRSAAENKVMQP